MERTIRYSYTYLVWEEGWPIVPGTRIYIGSRGCNIIPEEDYKYMGCFSDKTFTPKYKKILKVFKSREEAYKHEVYLHGVFDVDRNPYFANKSKQLISGFSRAGTKDSEETRNKKKEAISNYYLDNPSAREMMGKVTKGRKWFTDGHKDIRRFECPEGYRPGRTKTCSPMKGKKHSEKTRQKLKDLSSLRKHSKETKEKIRKASLNRKHSAQTKKKISEGRLGEKNPAYGSRWFTDGVNNKRSFECPDGYRPGRILTRTTNIL